MESGLTYTVVKGDTLWKIGRDKGMNWRVLAAYNKLQDPNKIFVGQKIQIPGGVGFQYMLDFLEALTYVTSNKIAGLITALQAILNGSNLKEIKEILIEWGLETEFFVLISRLVPYGAIVATLLLLLKWGYVKYYKSDEK